ncbi:hypothetical protein HTZ84_22270 [Haloterrigena sp. SYSU A558-1]|uniref:Halobacterial output domain-containing protein n=1 Tax=Haloterrigena gelatinilytica TaxID=2741724 RepID=A0ABX2LJD5_9EURY|nr:hypothetical protein [Haloterrigena gelatinilytica]NUC74993.1 hypothetical protein [Haloterrigena gelatinilytica]
MTSESADTPEVYPTDPETRLYPWQSAPSQIEQALEAARDGPTEREFINMLHSLDGISVLADGREEEWRPTQITVECHSEAMQSSSATRDLITIARRAGWQLASVGFNYRHQLTLEERGSHVE